MQHSNQEPYKTDEFDLVKLINLLVLRKLFIFGLTGFVTLLAIIYVSNITPTYKSTSLFTSPSAISILNLHKIGLTEESKESVFSRYLTSLSSKDVQIKVFLDGDYLTVFNPENKPIDDVDQFVSTYIQSVIISRPGLTVDSLKLGFLDELPYAISMEGANAEFLSSYLNELVVAVNTQTVNELINFIKQKIAIRLHEISIERGLLLDKAEQNRLNQIERIKEQDSQKIREINDKIDSVRLVVKENRLNEIVVLTDAAKLAKSLGIIENNFKVVSDDQIISNLTIAINENMALPEWYLFGERALVERIELLENRTNDDPFIPELITLNTKLKEIQNNNLLITLEARQDDSPFVAEIVKLDVEKIKLESNIIEAHGFNSMQLSQVAQTTPIKIHKIQIVSIAFIGGFIMSILLALFMGAFKPDEKNFA